jgi:hypothetical protein
MGHAAYIAALLATVLVPAASPLLSQDERTSRPCYATGRLWAPPPRPTLIAVARQDPPVSPVETAVQGFVRGANDRAAREEAARPPALPVWKGTVAGATFGIEGPWLIVAGAKVPAAVLGLLPITAGAPSPDQWEDARLLADRRADIERAATYASYRDYHEAAIADIRARREFERSLHEAQQRLPVWPADPARP